MYASPETPQATLSGLKNHNNFLLSQGGRTQQERMIKDKQKSLTKALQFSYQSVFVRRCGCCCDEVPVRGLINPNRVTQDYDEKTLSIGFEHGFKAGDIFEWVNTDTHWIIYLQKLTELAYFYGNIRRCDYVLSWTDEDNIIRRTYAAVKGPKEQTIDSTIVHSISLDKPNYTLEMLLPKNDETADYFKRYNKFYLQDVCWRIEATDTISMPGIIQIYAKEYYANEQADDMENGIVGGNLEPIEEKKDSIIVGEGFIKPKRWYEYSYKGETAGNWSYDTSLPIQAEIDADNKIKIKWNNTYSGQFELSFGDYTRTIVVESLF